MAANAFYKMKYDNITRAIFVKRPNRFIAEVEIGDMVSDLPC